MTCFRIAFCRGGDISLGLEASKILNLPLPASHTGTVVIAIGSLRTGLLTKSCAARKPRSRARRAAWNRCRVALRRVINTLADGWQGRVDAAHCSSGIPIRGGGLLHYARATADSPEALSPGHQPRIPASSSSSSSVASVRAVRS